MSQSNQLIAGAAGGFLASLLPKIVVQTEVSRLTTMCTIVDPKMICTFEANFDFTKFINGKPDRHHARFMIALTR